MLPTERISYSPITERPPLKLPGGARMVVWVIVNIEEWDPEKTMPRTVLTPPAGGSPSPDIPIWAWHGDKDRAVPTDRSRSMVKALKTAGGKPIYSELKGVGHGSWNNAYKPDSGLMKWMFKQKRGE